MQAKKTKSAARSPSQATSWRDPDDAPEVTEEMLARAVIRDGDTVIHRGGPKLKPLHPGEVLREEFLKPLKLSPSKLAKACGLPRTRIERIAEEKASITADTALRLSKALGNTAQFWMNLQNDFDLKIAEAAIGDELGKIAVVNGSVR